jgi:hypothetical protein
VAAIHISSGHKTQNFAVADSGSAAIQAGANSKGQTHEHQHINTGGGLGDLDKSGLCTVQNYAVADDVIAAATGQAQLREHKNLDTLGIGILNTIDYLTGIIVGICQLYYRGSGSDLYKSMLHLFFT